MYIDTLITLQENLATYAVEGKKVTGHVTMNSPGMIKCYIQNLKGQANGCEYALYAFSKVRDKGVRVGKLGKNKETKWMVNEKNVQSSGLKLEELDAVAIVAENDMRGTDTIAMGFKNNKYIIIPMIDEIAKTMKGNQSYSKAAYTAKSSNTMNKNIVTPDPIVKGTSPVSKANTQYNVKESDSYGGNSIGSGASVGYNKHAVQSSNTGYGNNIEQSCNTGNNNNVGQSSNTGNNNNVGQGSNTGNNNNVGQGSNTGNNNNVGQSGNMGNNNNAGQSSNAGNNNNVGQSGNMGYGNNTGQSGNMGNNNNTGQSGNMGYGNNVGQSSDMGYGNNVGQSGNMGYNNNAGQNSNTEDGTNQANYNGESIEDNESVLTKIAEKLQEVEKNPAIKKSVKSGITVTTGKSSNASAVRDEELEDIAKKTAEELELIIARLKEDKTITTKVQEIEKQLQELQNEENEAKAVGKCSIEEKLESRYTSQQVEASKNENQREILEENLEVYDATETLPDTSPRKALAFIHNCIKEFKEKGLASMNSNKKSLMNEQSIQGEVDYISEIDKKIKEIEERRKQERARE